MTRPLPSDSAVAELRARLAEALREVSAAENCLAELLGKLRAAPRAEKVTVTAEVEGAFTRLRAAREVLAGCTELIT